jgi:hypothetical protein
MSQVNEISYVKNAFAMKGAKKVSVPVEKKEEVDLSIGCFYQANY